MKHPVDFDAARAAVVSEYLASEGVAEEDWHSWGKYDCPLAEALDMADDDQSLGSADGFGCFRRFDDLATILQHVSSGAVYSETFDSLEALEASWSQIEQEYDESLIGYLSEPVVVVEASDHNLKFSWAPGARTINVEGTGWNRSHGSEDSFSLGYDGPAPEMADFMEAVRDYLRERADY